MVPDEAADPFQEWVICTTEYGGSQHTEDLDTVHDDEPGLTPER